MKFDRVLFGQREALAFFGQDMDQGRPFDLFDIFQSRDHRRDIMPVDGSDILKTQTFEEKSRGDQTKKESRILRAACLICSPLGKLLSKAERFFCNRMPRSVVNCRLKNDDTAPTRGSIKCSLSLRTRSSPGPDGLPS